jgi:hypothetical protein
MDNKKKKKKDKWICAKCSCPVEVGPIKAMYLSGNFDVELLRCPVCKNVLVPEDLALGQMLEVEQGLEDK